jgi:hypothetical protein
MPELGFVDLVTLLVRIVQGFLRTAADRSGWREYASFRRLPVWVYPPPLTDIVVAA